jgi:hypothetical protein
VLSTWPVAGPVYQCDFSSHYCSILRDCVLPVRLRYSGDGPPLLLGAPISDSGGIIVPCCVRTDWPEFPYSRDGITSTRSVHFGPCSVDLTCTLHWTIRTRPGRGARGRATTWREPFEIGQSAYCGSAQTQASGRRALEAFAKALGVALVGKFAQRGRPLGGHGPARRGGSLVSEGLPRRRRQDGPDPLSGRTAPKAGGPRRDARVMPALAAYVYAEGRRRLWGAQLVAGETRYITPAWIAYSSPSGL